MLIYFLVAVFLASVALAWRAGRSTDSLLASQLWTASVGVGLATVVVSVWRLIDIERKGFPPSPWLVAVLLGVYGFGFIILFRLKRA